MAIIAKKSACMITISYPLFDASSLFLKMNKFNISFSTAPA
jgi:hypothetical protein